MNGGAASGIAAAMAARRRRRIVAAFRVAGALSAESARAPDDLGVRKSPIFRRLARIGVLVDAGGERFYLDEEAEARAHCQRLHRVAPIMIAVVAVLVVVWILE